MQETYQTQNTALAIALTTCGAEIPTDEAGNSVPCVHLYDREILARLGYRGRKLEEAAQEAFNSGKKGLVVYQFVRNDLLYRIIKAYDEQSNAIKKLEAGSHTPLQSSGGINATPEDAARIICQALHNRKGALEAWRSVPATITIHGAQKKYTDGNGRSVIEGSMKAYSLGASEETRKHLGV